MRHLLLSILTLSATSIARNKWLKRSKGLRGLTKPLRLQLFSTDSSANMEWDAITGTWKNDKAAGTDNLPNPLYIFGYGSLIWKPSDVLENFSVFKSMCLGHRRTFFQRSMDHRGTPSFPGLVANLVDDQLLETSGWRLPHEEPSTCMGVSYLIPSDNIISVIAELDYRERGGYSRHLIPVKFIEDTPFHKAGEIVQVLVYTGLQKNPNFYLPILTNMIHYQYCLLKLSNIIAFAHGPSGANADYLINLTTYLRKSKISDDHLYELTRLVQNRLDRLPIPASKTDFCLIGWGSNEHGQLGSSLSLVSGSNLHRPVDISNILEQNFLPIAGVPKLFAGGTLSCALFPQGDLLLWGAGHDEVHRISGVKGVSLGHEHTALLMLSGEIVCVGSNEYGQCNIGSQYPTFAAIPLHKTDAKSLPHIVRAIAGVRNTLAIDDEGYLHSYGAIRHGVTLAHGPWKPADARVVDACCGLRHAAVVDSLGRVWSWGAPLHGGLGREGGAEPTLVALDDKVRWVEVVCGWSHTIAHGIRVDGSCVFVGWGRCDMGQLPGSEQAAVGDVYHLSDPVSGPAVSVWAAGESTFVCDAEGRVWGSGWNEHGNLGTDASPINTCGWMPTVDIKGQHIQLVVSNSRTAFACAGAHALSLGRQLHQKLENEIRFTGSEED